MNMDQKEKKNSWSSKINVFIVRQKGKVNGKINWKTILFARFLLNQNDYIFKTSRVN
jgi:hypothetical protein